MAKVLIYSHEIIGSAMAGPGIRAWEMALALTREHEVTLAAPNTPDVKGKGFRVVSYAGLRPGQLVAGFNVIVTQLVTPAMGMAVRRHGVRVILDAYDPILLEALEVFGHEPMPQQRNINRRYGAEMNLSLRMADAVVCASEKQRDLWIGVLAGLGRIRPDVYAVDPTLRGMVDVVPFGLRAENPEHRKKGKARGGEIGFRKRFGMRAEDKVLVWAGGIYEWYDTLTLIRAMAVVAHERKDIKLVFLGLKHPNAEVKESDLVARTKGLADKLGLTDVSVFFNFGWIPYEEWPEYLMETDIGLSTHFDHLETRFSFRTRVIDSYVWGLKPIITTQGDAMAELVVDARVGRVVGYEDVEGLARAIVELADDRAEYRRMQERMRDLREKYRWREVTKPMRRMVREVTERNSAARQGDLSLGEMWGMVKVYGYAFKQVRDAKGLGYIAKKMARLGRVK